MSKLLKLFILLLFILLSMALLWNWREKLSTKRLLQGEQIVAKINGYEINTSDFDTAMKPPLTQEEIFRNNRLIKEKILEDLILKKALIQFAQTQDFDKQKLFMKEIERFWEQALLKFLMQVKSDEFLKSISINESEIKERYRRDRYKYFAEVIYLKDLKAAQRLSKSGKNFSQFKNSLHHHITLTEPSQWWVIGDLPPSLEDQLVSLKPGNISPPIPFNDQWVVLQLLDTIETHMEPFEKVAPKLKDDLVQSRVQEKLSKWIESVRKNAKVDINTEILNAIDLQEIYGLNTKQGDSDEHNK